MSLTIEGIHHAYGARAVLEDIDLKVQPGEVVCLLGPSGCGKTTLLRLVAGLEELQKGRIFIGEEMIADPRRQMLPEQRGTGFLFQDFALFPHLTVLENTMFGLSTVRDKMERRRQALNALESVGMKESAPVYPHELSGGQQQRVALARALAPKPRIILLDEPFSSLDARLRVQIRDQTLHVLKSSGVATVMVTHDPEEAMFMGDRIALMHEGRIVQSGSPTELYAFPVSAFAATFFSDVNRLEGVVREGSIRTIFGPVPAGNFEEGRRVLVMFRPEAVSLTPEPSDRTEKSVPAEIETTRLLLGSTLVHLSLTSPDPEVLDAHGHARAPGLLERSEGDDIFVSLDHSKTFVFEK